MEIAELIKRAKTYYRTLLGKCFCPSIGSDIHFTAQGFQHIFYKKKKKKRDPADMARRLRLVHRAGVIVADPTAVVVPRRHSWGTEWGLTKVLGKKKITVVLRRKGAGNIQYHSIVDEHVKTA